MRRAFAVILLVAAALNAVRPPCARAQAPSPAAAESATVLRLPASGGDGHGWFALPGQAGVTFPTIYHLPPDAEPGVVRSGPRLRDFPEALASSGDRLVIVMPRERVDPSEGADAEGADGDASAGARAPARLLRRVQTLRVTRQASGVWGYEPVGREPIALPSLPGRGELRGVAMAHGTVFALIQGAPAEADAPGETPGRNDHLALLREGAFEWKAASLPGGWRVGEPGRLLARGSGLVLLQDGRAWEAAAPAASRGVEGAWSALALEALVDDAAFIVAGSSVIVARPEAGGLTLDLLREGSSTPLRSIGRDVRQYAVVGGGDHATVIWRGEAEPTRLRATVISAISGEVLFDDFARTNAVVSGREIQSLGLLIGALMLTILVFVLRPEEAMGGAIVIPEGYALAGPMRRVLAVLIDLAPPLGLAALVFDVGGRELLDAAVLSDDSTTRGAVALATAFMLAGVHSVAGEWLFGRTLGKAALRCRTANLRGERPRLWQAGLRTLVKFLFPPFALFLFLDVRRRHPGDLVAGAPRCPRRRPDRPARDDAPTPS